MPSMYPDWFSRATLGPVALPNDITDEMRKILKIVRKFVGES